MLQGGCGSLSPVRLGEGEAGAAEPEAPGGGGEPCRLWAGTLTGQQEKSEGSDSASPVLFAQQMSQGALSWLQPWAQRHRCVRWLTALFSFCAGHLLPDAPPSPTRVSLSLSLSLSHTPTHTHTHTHFTGCDRSLPPLGPHPAHGSTVASITLCCTYAMPGGS